MELNFLQHNLTEGKIQDREASPECHLYKYIISSSQEPSLSISRFLSLEQKDNFIKQGEHKPAVVFIDTRIPWGTC